MDALFAFVKTQGGKLRSRVDDNMVDRIQHKWTAGILVLFAVVLTTQGIAGKPIDCWIHSETFGQTGYVNSICWISNTYFVPYTEDIPDASGMKIVVPEREEREVTYYQWVPFVLLLQAFLFNVPCLIWRAFNDKSGIPINDIMEMLYKVRTSDKSKTIETVSAYMDRVLLGRRQPGNSWFRRLLSRACCLCCGLHNGNFMSALYIFVKLLYVANIIAQLALLKWFLQSKSWLVGSDVLEQLVKSPHEWRNTGVFPRNTMCDFLIRVLGNFHRHTVQCVLPINMYNEKIFIILSFWFLILAAITIVDFFVWILHILPNGVRRKYIRGYLCDLMASRDCAQGERFDMFMSRHLRQDGVFLMRMIKQNEGQVVMVQVLFHLWKMYSMRQATVRQLNNDDSRHPIGQLFGEDESSGSYRDGSYPDS